MAQAAGQGSFASSLLFVSINLCSVTASKPLQHLYEEIVTNAGQELGLLVQCCSVSADVQVVRSPPLHQETCNRPLPTTVEFLFSCLGPHSMEKNCLKPPHLGGEPAYRDVLHGWVGSVSLFFAADKILWLRKPNPCWWHQLCSLVMVCRCICSYLGPLSGKNSKHARQLGDIMDPAPWCRTVICREIQAIIP